VIEHRPGFAHAERAYARADLAPRLRLAGIRRVGIITGRNRNEMRTPLAALDFDGLLVQEAIFTDEDGHKPDPDLLVRAVARLNARDVIMVGDSIDDLRLVLNYRQLPTSQQQARTLFVAIDHDGDADRWRRLGADAVLSDVNELPDWLLSL
jgi:phosphoglycolate phosphatase-like HAD superfamily hydrolase